MLPLCFLSKASGGIVTEALCIGAQIVIYAALSARRPDARETMVCFECIAAFDADPVVRHPTYAWYRLVRSPLARRVQPASYGIDCSPGPASTAELVVVGVLPFIFEVG